MSVIVPDSLVGRVRPRAIYNGSDDIILLSDSEEDSLAESAVTETRRKTTRSKRSRRETSNVPVDPTDDKGNKASSFEATTAALEVTENVRTAVARMTPLAESTANLQRRASTAAALPAKSPTAATRPETRLSASGALQSVADIEQLCQRLTDEVAPHPVSPRAPMAAAQASKKRKQPHAERRGLYDVDGDPIMVWGEEFRRLQRLELAAARRRCRTCGGMGHNSRTCLGFADVQ